MGRTERHEEIVIRRAGAIDATRQQLAARRRSKDNDLDDPDQVIYSSPLIDVAANMELVRETIDACTLILIETAWQIRLLSKSNLLPLVAAGIPEKYKARVVYGVSTGTLNDNLARAFEQGTPLVSKRIHSLHVLQNRGYRTFGMICPSLPLPGGDYSKFARTMYDAIRGDLCEHVWGEVINVRGDSMVRTVNALQTGGFDAEAAALAKVSTDKAAWEEYARATFEAHAPLYPSGKLRFLQYVTRDSKPWWAAQQARGGHHALICGVCACSYRGVLTVSVPSLSTEVWKSFKGRCFLLRHRLYVRFTNFRFPTSELGVVRGMNNPDVIFCGDLTREH